MITEKIGTITVKRNDDINELVVENYNLFNEYGLYDAEAGCDLKAIQKHFERADYYIAHKKVEELLQVRKNMHQAFYHIFQKNNFPALQWAVMVNSVDDVPLSDLSLDNLKALITLLSSHGLTQAKVLADVEAAKKKSGHN